MQYKYRWWYAGMLFFVGLGLGYFYDLQFIINSLTVTQAQFQQLSAKRLALAGEYFIKNNKKKVKTKKNISWQIPSTLEVLNELSVWENASGVTIKSVSKEIKHTIHGMKVGLIHMQVKGDFQQITAFINKIFLKPLLILNFNYRLLKQNQMLMDLDLLMIPLQFNKPEVSLVKFILKSNPFCNGSFNSNPLENFNPLSIYSINQLQMVGYIGQGDKRLAIISMPNHALLNIGLGDNVGKEQGRVKQILPDQVVFLLANQKEMKLTL